MRTAQARVVISMERVLDNKKHSINKSEIITNYTNVYFISAIVSLLFTINKTMNIGIVGYLGAFILAIAMIYIDINKALLLMIALVPNIRVIKLTGSDMAILGYCFLLAELRFLLAFHQKGKISLPVLALTCSVMLTIIINRDYSYILTYFRFFIFIIFIIDYSKKDEKTYLNENMAKLFVFGTILNIICGFIYYYSAGLPITVGRFKGVSVDPNYYAAVIAVSMAFVFLMLIYTKHRLFCIVLELFLLVSGVLSVSRMFVLSLFWILFASLLSLMSRNSWRKILPALIVCGVLLIATWGFLSPIVSNMIDRFNSDSTEGGNGRTDAWLFYLAGWKKSVVSFVFGNSSNLEIFMSPWPTVQHNFYIESLSQIGLFGSLSLFAVFTKIFRIQVVEGKQYVLGFTPLIVALTCYFFLNALFSDTSSIILITCFYFYSYIKNRVQLDMKQIEQ